MREDKKDVAVLEDGSTEVALTPEQEAKNLLDEASKSSGQPLLKFRGDQEEPFHVRDDIVPLGTRFYAYPSAWERQWVRFDDDKVTDRIRVRVATKKLLPARNTLSDPQLEDTKEDPWSFQNVIPLESVNDGTIMLFTSSSVGGKIAIEQLAKAASEAVLAGKARGLPIIELKVGSFKSGYGKDVDRPDFPIVDWENPDPNAAMKTAPEIIVPEKKKAKVIADDFEDDAPSKSDMDDEIPF